MLRTSVSRTSASKRNGGSRRNGSSKVGSARNGRASKPDAIALLKADHREVERWFGQFEKSGSSVRRQELAARICAALEAHTTIEEEIFYPAYLEATGDEKLHHEAEIEHEGAKRLIAEIESSGADDDYFAARVTVLSEMIKHHVKEEEKRGGLFAKARRSRLDLDALGERLATRKAELVDLPRPAGLPQPLEERP